VAVNQYQEKKTVTRNGAKSNSPVSKSMPPSGWNSQALNMDHVSPIHDMTYFRKIGLWFSRIL